MPLLSLKTASLHRLAVSFRLLPFIALLLAGCASSNSGLSPFVDDLVDYAQGRGWERRNYDTPQGFRFTGFRSPGLRVPQQGSSQRLVIFIERDGVWVSRTQQAADPTPDNPDMIRLAMNDPSPLKLYLGRPCMFLTDAERGGCSPRYWNLHRYAPEAVAAMSAAIDQEKAATGAARIFLVGWSGGGTVAALLAAQRQDVDGFATIAANLDHAAWTRMMRVAPLTNSLNPVDFAARLGSIPQWHFTGGQDNVVPEAVLQSYRAHLGNSANIRVIRLARFDHDCCWARDWARLAQDAGLYAP